MTQLPEIFIDTRGEAGIDNLDELLAEFPLLAKRAVNSALKSEGNRLRTVMQQAIRRGGPEGAMWPQRSVYHWRLMKDNRSRFWGYRKNATKLKHRSKSFDPYSADGSSGKKPGAKPGVKPTGTPLTKFIGGLRYDLDDELSMLTAGFVNPNAGFEKMLGQAATGFETPVTRRMQKFFFSLGLPLKKSTTALKSPARPLIGPVWENEKSAIEKNLSEKFFANLDRYVNGGSKK